MCVELNAHALITYVITITDYFHGDRDKFLPYLQTCEWIFQFVRNMSSVFSTVLNFSILGLLRWPHQIDIQQADSQEVIKFPSMERHCSKEGKNKLSKSSLTDISDGDIAKAVQNKAKITLEKLGMDQDER